ncbi:uncharacterized protein LOC132721129 [Ruditapes philippinarum]|uniref:uncharacterized protein LOC132721129 n=1 Tax=Ruditapes philippinarum TaxID=129788 RepID=UPI00295B6857|nr:uncharacterized protein LOC132721129 [Ruditapes philippinarum]
MDILFRLRGQLVLLFPFVINLSHCDVSHQLWIYKPELENMTASSGYRVRTRSSVGCGRTCSINDTCISFFVMPTEQLNCQLHDTVLDATDGLSYVQKSYYYVLGGAGITSTTPIPTAQPFSCPPDDTIFRTVQLSDGELFTYKVVKVLETQSNAIAGCASQGGFLSRVKTVAKMNMLLDLVRNCTGYSGEEYYVDGSNASADDWYAPGAWTFVDGEPVPMTSDFWGSTYPNDPHVQHCLRMQMSAANYKFDDISCTEQRYYICEK